MPPTAESIEILTAEKESLQDRLTAAQAEANDLRAKVRKLAALLSSAPGLPLEVYKLLR